MEFITLVLHYKHSYVITLLDLITGKEKDYHVSDMKPFVFDSAITNPIDVARRDRMEFVYFYA